MARPSTAPIRKQTSLNPEVARALDRYRFGAGYKTEAEAIRKLIELGLEVAQKRSTANLA